MPSVKFPFIVGSHVVFSELGILITAVNYQDKEKLSVIVMAEFVN